MINALSISFLLVFIWSAKAAGAEGCDPNQTEIATTPVIEQSPRRLQNAQKQREPQDADPSLLLVGDSLVQQWQPYVRESFPKRAVHNFGVSGDKTQELLWRLRHLAPRNISPSEIVVLVGTNNLTDKSTTPCGVSSGIQAVVAEIGRQWPNATTFLIEILPRGERFAFRDKERREVNSSLAKHYVGSRSVAVVSVDEEKLTCSRNTDQCSMFKRDLLHLNADGYRVIRDAIGQTSISLFNRDRLR